MLAEARKLTERLINAWKLQMDLGNVTIPIDYILERPDHSQDTILAALNVSGLPYNGIFGKLLDSSYLERVSKLVLFTSLLTILTRPQQARLEISESQHNPEDELVHVILSIWPFGDIANIDKLSDQQIIDRAKSYLLELSDFVALVAIQGAVLTNIKRYLLDLPKQEIHSLIHQAVLKQEADTFSIEPFIVKDLVVTVLERYRTALKKEITYILTLYSKQLEIEAYKKLMISLMADIGAKTCTFVDTLSEYFPVKSTVTGNMFVIPAKLYSKDEAQDEIIADVLAAIGETTSSLLYTTALGLVITGEIKKLRDHFRTLFDIMADIGQDFDVPVEAIYSVLYHIAKDVAEIRKAKEDD